MPPLILLAAVVTSVSTGVLVWALTAGPDVTRQRVVNNLRRGLYRDAKSTAAEVRDNEPGGLASLARRLTPAGIARHLDNLHGRAGRPAAWPMERLLVAKIVLPAAGMG